MYVCMYVESKLSFVNINTVNCKRTCVCHMISVKHSSHCLLHAQVSKCHILKSSVVSTSFIFVLSTVNTSSTYLALQSSYSFFCPLEDWIASPHGSKQFHSDLLGKNQQASISKLSVSCELQQPYKSIFTVNLITSHNNIIHHMPHKHLLFLV